MNIKLLPISFIFTLGIASFSKAENIPEPHATPQELA